MAHADALTFGGDHGGYGVARWAAAGLLVVIAHAGVWTLLRQAPEGTGPSTQPAIEMDLIPAPSGAANMVDPGAEANAEARPEQINETPPDEVKPVEDEPEMLPEPSTDKPLPPEEPDTAHAETPPEPTPETKPDVAEISPDVTPAVPLPPEEAVTAEEEQPETPKVTRKPEPKRQAAKRDTPKKEVSKPTERPRQQASDQQRLGGAGGVSSASGAASAASAASYGNRLTALIRAQKRYPVAAIPQKLEGRTVVRFTINRSGRVVGQSIVSSSGHTVLDEALKDMVRRASPSFPPMPAEMAGATHSYDLPFGFTFR